MVGDIAVPTITSLTSQRVEAIGMVGGLHGTGSDPGPSQYRAALLEEMQVRGVAQSQRRAGLEGLCPGDHSRMAAARRQKGDHFDIELRVPSQSDTTSLRGGALWETRLMEMAVMDDRQVHHGNLLALAQGPVLIDPSHGTATVEPSAAGKAAAPDRGVARAVPGPGSGRRRGPEIPAAGSGAHARLSEREIRRRRGQRHQPPVLRSRKWHPNRDG